jgi:hypothetical protein
VKRGLCRPDYGEYVKGDIDDVIKFSGLIRKYFETIYDKKEYRIKKG